MISRPWLVTKVEWQVFHDKENTEKWWKLSTKRKTQKIAENTFFGNQKQKQLEIFKKIIVFDYLKVKFIIKILRLVLF